MRFEELVDSEFLSKYAWRISDAYHAVDSNGLLVMGAIRDVFNAFDGEHQPQQFTYALIHGPQSLISSWNVPGEFRGKTEDIYGLCLERDCTWEDLIGKPKVQNGLLL